MEYPEKFEQAMSYAGQAVELMKSHQVPPHPGNFAIWYTYVSGNYPDLRRAVDILISNKMDFDEKVLMDLRQKFFGHENESQALHKATQRIEVMLGQMMGVLGNAVQGANSYGETLKSFSDTLQDKDKLGDIRDMLKTVMTETRSIAEASAFASPARIAAIASRCRSGATSRPNRSITARKLGPARSHKDRARSKSTGASAASYSAKWKAWFADR